MRILPAQLGERAGAVGAGRLAARGLAPINGRYKRTASGRPASLVTTAGSGPGRSPAGEVVVEEGTVEFRRINGLPPYVFAAINQLRDEARHAGDDVIDLGFGNPDIRAPRSP